MKKIYKKLLKKAKEVLKNSYSPYSKFKVSSSLITEEGKIFTGVNVENASYGLTICAERVAIFKAVSQGYKNIKAILVYADKNPCYPCGACLQVMSEFNKNMKILIFDGKNIIENELKDLLKKPYNKLF